MINLAVSSSNFPRLCSASCTTDHWWQLDGYFNGKTAPWLASDVPQEVATEVEAKGVSMGTGGFGWCTMRVGPVTVSVNTLELMNNCILDHVRVNVLTPTHFLPVVPLNTAQPLRLHRTSGCVRGLFVVA